MEDNHFSLECNYHDMYHIYCHSALLMEDKRNGKVQRDHAHWNPKRHIPPMSLFLYCKMVAMYCFIWSLVLRQWLVSAWVRQNSKFLQFFYKIRYPAAWKCFLVINITFVDCYYSVNFSSHKMFKGWFLEAGFLVANSTISPISTLMVLSYCMIMNWLFFSMC